MYRRSSLRSSSLIVGSLIIVTAMAFVPPLGLGQTNRRHPIAGRWTFNGSVPEGEAIVAQSVEPALMYVRPNIQALARERIAESTWLPEHIRIRVRRDHVTVDLRGQEHRVFAGQTGRPIQVRTRHGYAELTQYLDANGALHQRFVALEGTQHNIYHPEENGRMRLEVRLESPSLPQPVHFTLNYRRGR